MNSSSTLTLGVGATSWSGIFQDGVTGRGIVFVLKGASVRVAARAASKHQTIEQGTMTYGYYVMIM